MTTNQIGISMPSAGPDTPGSGPPYSARSTRFVGINTEPTHTTVLVVDDNLTDVWLVNEALDENGASSALLVATDGEEAEALLDRIDHDLIPCPNLMVIDLNLPKGSGFEVLKRIRSGPKCRASPVVVFSSSNAPSDKREAMRLGADAYIEKPYNLSDLPGVGKRLKQLMAGEDEDSVH